MVDANATSSAVHYGGFWRRVVALIIDYLLVSFVLFALFAVAALVAPSAADLVDLSEFGWLNVERTLETKPPTGRVIEVTPPDFVPVTVAPPLRLNVAEVTWVAPSVI